MKHYSRLRQKHLRSVNWDLSTQTNHLTSLGLWVLLHKTGFWPPPAHCGPFLKRWWWCPLQLTLSVPQAQFLPPTAHEQKWPRLKSFTLPKSSRPLQMKLLEMRSYGSGVSHKSPTYEDIYSKSLTLAPSAANASQRIKAPPQFGSK